VKICSTCKTEKPESEFHKGKYSCKECRNKKNREYKRRNKEKIKAYEETYKERRNELRRKRYHEKEKHDPEYKEMIAIRKKKYLSTEKGKEKRKIWDKRYRERHPEKIREKRQKPINKIRSNLRARFRKVIYRSMLNENTSMSKESLRMLGCSIKEWRDYLENQFQEGMSWENYGEWHIDHIKPVSSFDLEKEEERMKAFNYTNTQPLWADENLSKGAKYDRA